MTSILGLTLVPRAAAWNGSRREPLATRAAGAEAHTVPRPRRSAARRQRGERLAIELTLARTLLSTGNFGPCVAVPLSSAAKHPGSAIFPLNFLERLTSRPRYLSFFLFDFLEACR